MSWYPGGGDRCDSVTGAIRRPDGHGRRVAARTGPAPAASLDARRERFPGGRLPTPTARGWERP